MQKAFWRECESQKCQSDMVSGIGEIFFPDKNKHQTKRNLVCDWVHCWNGLPDKKMWFSQLQKVAGSGYSSLQHPSTNSGTIFVATCFMVGRWMEDQKRPQKIYWYWYRELVIGEIHIYFDVHQATKVAHSRCIGMVPEIWWYRVAKMHCTSLKKVGLCRGFPSSQIRGYHRMKCGGRFTIGFPSWFCWILIH